MLAIADICVFLLDSTWIVLGSVFFPPRKNRRRLYDDDDDVDSVAHSAVLQLHA